MVAKKFSPEYSSSDILGLYKARMDDTDEARLRRLIESIRTYVKMEHTVYIPETYRAITREQKTPFFRDSWHRITSSLVAKTPVAHVTPKDERKAPYRDAANIAERFIMAMIETFNEEQGTDIPYQLTANLVRDGESDLKVVHRPQAWANFPERQESESADDYDDNVEIFKRTANLPIAWRSVDRLSMLFDEGEYGDTWAMEYGEYAKPYLRNRYSMVDYNNRLMHPKRLFEGKPYPEALNPTSRTRAVKVEFFTPYEWHVIIDQTEAPGWPKRNPYGPHLPYFRAKAYDGESLLYSLIYLVPRLDELLTMKLNWAALSAYPNPLLKYLPNAAGMPALEGPLGNSGDASGPSNTVKWSPGEMIDVPIGRDLSFLVPPPTGQDLNDLIQILKGLIDIAGIPSIMRGIGSSDMSGYLGSQLRAAAEMAYKLAASSSQRQLKQATEFSMWLVAHIIRQPIFVQGWDSLSPISGKHKKDSKKEWLGLSPDKNTSNIADVNFLGPVSFQFRPTLPTDDQARAMIALQLTNAQKPLSDRRHALEFWLQEEDPDAILDAIDVEQASEEEPLRSMIIEHALREAGLLPEPKPEPPPQVDQFGQPMMTQSPESLQPVPLVNQMPPGGPAVPGVTMPLQPGPPGPAPAGGVPGMPGGRPAGVYPGLPGGPNLV